MSNPGLPPNRSPNSPLNPNLPPNPNIPLNLSNLTQVTEKPNKQIIKQDPMEKDLFGTTLPVMPPITMQPRGTYINFQRDNKKEQFTDEMPNNKELPK